MRSVKRNCVSSRGIAYKDVGEGPCVLLVHAFGFDADMWEPQVEHMTSAGYRIIAPDVRGFGESPGPSEDHTFQETVDDVAGVLEDADVDHAVVGGLSMGAAVAVALTVAYPNRVDGLLIADNSLPDGFERATAASERILTIGLNALSEVYEPILFGQAYRSSHENAIAGWRDRLIARDQRQLATLVLAYHNRPSPAEDLMSISMPTTIVFGEEDAAIPEPRRNDYVGIPGALHERIPGAGHMSNVERPDEFNAVLLALARRVPAVRSFQHGEQEQ